MKKNIGQSVIALFLAALASLGFTACDNGDKRTETTSGTSISTSSMPTKNSEEVTVSTEVPTVESTEVPTVESTEVPTVESTEVPTVESTEVPTVESTEVPTVESTAASALNEAVVNVELTINYTGEGGEEHKNYTISTSNYFEGEVDLNDFLTQKDEKGNLVYGFTGIDVSTISEQVKALCSKDGKVRFNSYSGEDITVFRIFTVGGELIYSGGVVPGNNGYTFIIFEAKNPMGGKTITAFENDRSARVNFIVSKMELSVKIMEKNLTDAMFSHTSKLAAAALNGKSFAPTTKPKMLCGHMINPDDFSEKPTKTNTLVRKLPGYKKIHF